MMVLSDVMLCYFENKIYVILDGPGYNKAMRTREFAQSIGIELIYLPPYSPNLNPNRETLEIYEKESN